MALGGRASPTGAQSVEVYQITLGFDLFLADDGRHHVRALEMARDEINAAGGLLGRPVELVIADVGNCTAPELAAVRDTLKAANVDVVNYNWTVVPATSKYLMEVGVLVMHHGWVTVDWKAWYDVRDTFKYWMTLMMTLVQ